MHVGAAQGRRLAERRPGRALLAGRGGTRGVGRAGLVADGDRGQQPVARACRRRPSAGPTPRSPDGWPTLARLTPRPRSPAARSATAANAALGDRQRSASTDRTPARTRASTLSFREARRRRLRDEGDDEGSEDDTWQATLATDANGISRPGQPAVLRRPPADARPRAAHDAGPPRARSPSSTAPTPVPTLASLKASPGTVFTNPAACDTRPKTTTVSLTATDVDGVDRGHPPLPPARRLGVPRQATMAKNGSSVARHREAGRPAARTPDGKVDVLRDGKDALGKSTQLGHAGRSRVEPLQLPGQLRERQL